MKCDEIKTCQRTVSLYIYEKACLGGDKTYCRLSGIPSKVTPREWKTRFWAVKATYINDTSKQIKMEEE